MTGGDSSPGGRLDGTAPALSRRAGAAAGSSRPVRTTPANCTTSVMTRASRMPEPGTRDRNRVPSVATPRASEDCWVVTITPLPTPARAGGTSDSTIRMSDGQLEAPGRRRRRAVPGSSSTRPSVRPVGAAPPAR